MTRNKKVDVQTAIALLKAGGTMEHIIISDLTTSKVNAIDALLLAENGCIVPDGNIVYHDEDIQYDPDFDEVTWDKPVSFKQLKEISSSEVPHPPGLTTFVVNVPVTNSLLKQWLAQNQEQVQVEIIALIERMYKSQSH